MARTARQSAHLKKRFLEVFGEMGIISRAAESVGVDRNTIYYWQEHDPNFATAFQQAEIRSTEVLEIEARRRAVEGVVSETPIRSRTGELLDTIVETKYSDTLLIFLLKARNPAKYRDNVRLEHTGAEGGPIQVEHEVGYSADARRQRILAFLANRAGTGVAGVTVGAGSSLDSPGWPADEGVAD